MVVNAPRSAVIPRTCSICRAAPAVVRVTLSDPLIASVSTLCCSICRDGNEQATAEILALDPRLVVTVVSA
jgi:hypothetical protein